jgi:ADP-ribose pyrophosphatase YjhB (NUDIX family)
MDKMEQQAQRVPVVRTTVKARNEHKNQETLVPEVRTDPQKRTVPKGRLDQEERRELAALRAKQQQRNQQDSRPLHYANCPARMGRIETLIFVALTSLTAVVAFFVILVLLGVLDR